MLDPGELDIAPQAWLEAYRIGVIGAGKIVRECHLPAYRMAGWEVVRIASRTAESAQAAADVFGIPDASDDFLDVIHDARVEVVDISLPSHRHREVAVAALGAGSTSCSRSPWPTRSRTPRPSWQPPSELASSSRSIRTGAGTRPSEPAGS